MLSSNEMSPADIAAVTGNNGNCSSGGWGGSWGEWILVFLIFAVFGWGGFGGGFGGAGNGGGALTRADLCQDMNFGQLENGVRGISQGICDSTFALNNTITNGFHGVDNAICNLGFQTQQGFNQTNIALMQGQNALSRQLADCCCENRQGQADIKYQMATDTCAIQNTIQNTTRDVIDNVNSNTRQILDFLVQDRFASMQNENNALRARLDRADQNTYITNTICNQTEALINRIAPYPVPSYNVPAPYPYCQQNNNCGSCGRAC